MTQDYGEIICTAIDEIVTTRLQGIECDITKLCTVIDDTYNYQGKYKVSDGGAKFEAFSADTNYRNGNSVLVTIPNGNFNLQKTIIGRVANTDTAPFKYTPPLETMIQIKDDLLENSIVPEKGLLANYQNASTMIKCFEINDFSDGLYEGFTRLGISADFKSLLNGLDVIEGIYGLKFLIYADKLKTTEDEGTEGVWELNFNSIDMVGNPYQFESYFNQEKVFDISSIKNIKKIEIYFYQNGQFKNGSKEYIEWSYYDSLSDKNIALRPNLFVKNIKFYFGYELTKYSGETLELFPTTQDSYNYSNENLSKDITLRWIHQNEDKSFTILQPKDIKDSNLYDVKWYKYNYGYDVIDEYAGPNWEPIIQNITEYFNCKFTPDIKNQTEEIKVLGLIKTPTDTDINPESEYYEDLKALWDEIDKDAEDLVEQRWNAIEEYFGENDVPSDILIPVYTTTAYSSNILIFHNTEKVVDALTYEAATALSILCEDESEGNYFIYDQNGKIIDDGAGRGKIRKFKAMYKSTDITPSIGKLDYIKWYLPFDNDSSQYSNQEDSLAEGNTHTMIVKNEELWGNNDGIFRNNLTYAYYDISLKDGVDYIGIKRLPKEDGSLETSQEYMIKNYWSQQDANNTIRCEVSIDGTIYEAIENLQFGRSGTNGSNTTFVLEMMNGKNALKINSGDNKETLQIRAILYDSNGKIINLSNDEYNNIKWSWFRQSDEKYMSIPENSTGQMILITCEINTIPNDNYYILQAEYGSNPTLQAFLPIPLKTAYTSQIEGARDVLYNHQGNPTYYSDAYVIYDENYQELLPVDLWKIQLDEQNAVGAAADYLPKLKTITREHRTNYRALQASSLYASGFNDKVCVSYLSDDGKYGWSQPILIMQSNYDFAMLNKWDGGLTLDENNGTILSTMLGAGRKDSQNRFSGVLIGDIESGTGLENTEVQTGVYGLHEGVISYALKEDGTATFGKNGHGQIKIDGNSGTIQSQNFEKNGIGMGIDLDQGIIDIKSGSTIVNAAGQNVRSQASVEISPFSTEERSYFKIKSDSGNPLIDIKNNSYFLQSNNYSDNKGMRINLDSGNINIKRDNTEIILQPDPNIGEPYFRIKAQGYPLINIADSNYYLQSQNYSSHEDNSLNNNWGQQVYYYPIGFNYNQSQYYYFSKDNNLGKYVYNIQNIDNNNIISYSVLLKNEQPVEIPIYTVLDNDEDFKTALEENKIDLSEYTSIGDQQYQKIEVIQYEQEMYKYEYNSDNRLLFIIDSSNNITENEQFLINLDETLDSEEKLWTYNPEKDIFQKISNDIIIQEFDSGDNIIFKYENGEYKKSSQQVDINIQDGSWIFNNPLYEKNISINTDKIESRKKYVYNNNDKNYYTFSWNTDQKCWLIDRDKNNEIIVHNDTIDISKFTYDEYADRYRFIFKEYIYIEAYKYIYDTKEEQLIKYSWQNGKWSTEGQEMPTKEIIRDNVRNDRIEAFEGSISSVKGIGQGMRVNLARGEINGYNLYLKANSRNNPTTKYVLIDSGADETIGHPFQVGANFKVKWDGTLNCNKVETLNNDGRADRAISISNNFYVTKSGGAGGSGVSFGGSFRGGFSGTGSGNFSGKFNGEASGSFSGTATLTSLKLGGSTISKYSKSVVTGITSLSGETVSAFTELSVFKSTILGTTVFTGWDNQNIKKANVLKKVTIKFNTSSVRYLGYSSSADYSTSRST